jgi:hypothetical protein
MMSVANIVVGAAKRLGLRLVAALALVAIVLVCFGRVPGDAQGASSWSLTKAVIASGGGTSITGEWVLAGTAGQPVVGAAAGSSTSLSAGFWAGGVMVSVGGRTVYLPAVRR